MERDFMGGLAAAVKQEFCDEEEIIDAAPVRSLAMQWSFSKKGGGGGAVMPQLYSFHGGGGGEEEEDYKNPYKTGFDSLAFNGLVTITTTTNTTQTSFDEHSHLKSSYPPPPGVMQSVGQINHPAVKGGGGVRYSVTTYPAVNLHDKHHNNNNNNNNNILHGTPSHSFLAAVSPQPPLAANAIMPRSTTVSPIVGTTDLRNSSSSCKISRAPAQLTIFYNGSVCAYDNISSDKAQAIMLLAGNGPPPSTTTTTPAASTSCSFVEGFVSSNPQPKNYVVATPQLSPVPVSSPIISHHVLHSASRSGIIDNDAATKHPGGVLVPSSSSSYKSEPAVISVTPLRSVPPTTFAPSGAGNAVPQFRRKSLARFLEKRKERVICTPSPYEKECSNTRPGRGGGVDSSTSLSANSSGSCHVIGSISN